MEIHRNFVKGCKRDRMSVLLPKYAQESIEKNRAKRTGYEKHHGYWVTFVLSKAARKIGRNPEELDKLEKKGKLLVPSEYVNKAFKAMGLKPVTFRNA